jgi:CheY-like chemotaxis protein
MDVTSQGKLILCVDDEVSGLFARKMILESQGYRVLTAENGPDALALFASHAVDLVVLDYALPGMHGGIVAEKMKALNPTIRIIMLSAYVDLPKETLALTDMSIVKGQPPTALLTAILQLLGGSEEDQSRSISVA